jgi:hypothetical protein
MRNQAKRTRVGYCIWLESLSEDVIKGQVLDVLEAIAKRDNGLEIIVLAFARLDDYIANRQRWNDIRRDIVRRGVRLLVLPNVLFPGRFELFFAQWYLLPIVAFFAFPALFFATTLLNLKILHLRSYPLIPATILLKKVLSSRRIILDTRSPFPEESVSSGKWKLQSLTFRLWKRIEAAAVTCFEATVCVTHAHAKTLPSSGTPNGMNVIPNNAAGPSRPHQARDVDYACRLATYSDTFRFVYVGSLSRKGVSRPEIYGEIVIRLRKLDFKHHFLFVTRETDLIKTTFDGLGIAMDEYTIRSCEPEDVPDILATTHAGLNFLNRPDLRMSVKTAEYLASGLPFLCNENVLGALDIVEEYAVGLAVTMTTLEAEADKLAKNYKDFLDRARDMHKYFSTDRVANDYFELYLRLM